MAVQSKLPLLIIGKVQKLAQQMIPTISQIVEKTGIQNIGQPNMVMPNTCLPQSDLQDILKLRNNLINKLNIVSKTVKVLSKPIDPLTIAVDVTKKTLQTTKTARIVANTALLAIPPAIPIPGQIISSINTLKDLEDLITPLITLTSNKVTSISTALDYANKSIFKILSLLKTIDQYLLKCGISKSDLLSIDDSVNKIDQQYAEVQEKPNNEEIYQGFTLEIVEEPYSPTVNRRKAVAKNTQGIILLSTPLSFTTETQILISELKLLIDSNNLKAD